MYAHAHVEVCVCGGGGGGGGGGAPAPFHHFPRSSRRRTLLVPAVLSAVCDGSLLLLLLIERFFAILLVILLYMYNASYTCATSSTCYMLHACKPIIHGSGSGSDDGCFRRTTRQKTNHMYIYIYIYCQGQDQGPSRPANCPTRHQAPGISTSTRPTTSRLESCAEQSP